MTFSSCSLNPHFVLVRFTSPRCFSGCRVETMTLMACHDTPMPAAVLSHCTYLLCIKLVCLIMDSIRQISILILYANRIRIYTPWPAGLLKGTVNDSNPYLFVSKCFRRIFFSISQGISEIEGRGKATMSLEIVKLSD